MANLILTSLTHGFLISPYPNPLIHHHLSNYEWSSEKLTSSKMVSKMSSSSDGDGYEDYVTVYDNVFSSSACDLLHEAVLEHNERCNDGSSVFLRVPYNERPLSPVEHAIDSFLSEIGDPSRLVEYWSRDEYINIDVHADIDEAMLEEEDVLRCPLMGHVLYLQMEENVLGPTVVFPQKQVGWKLMEEEDDDDDVEMVTVPIVKGRVLRFPGGAMHAVPRPYYRWLSLVSSGDDGNEDNIDIERSVLLFNTWKNGEAGPIGVDGDLATGAIPEGIEMSQADIDAYLKEQENQIILEWEEDYGKCGKYVKCIHKNSWEVKNINILNSFGNKPDIQDYGHDHNLVNVELMGKEHRRLYPDKIVNLAASRKLVKQGLEELSQVSSIRLSKPR